jgi:AcrR family transcriptional regulator
MDRRVLKSREAILEAFVGLIAEKNFEQITINEIADRANVSRGTVYLHYTDKFDLLDQCIKTHLVQLVDSCLPCGSTGLFPSKDALEYTFRYLSGHAFFYAAVLANKGVPAFRNRLQAALLRGLDKQIDMSGINRDMNKEMMAQFLASAIGGMIEWWITRSMPCSEAEIAGQLWTLLERNQMVPQQS